MSSTGGPGDKLTNQSGRSFGSTTPPRPPGITISTLANEKARATWQARGFSFCASFWR
jgi:hypothetical protein